MHYAWCCVLNYRLTYSYTFVVAPAIQLVYPSLDLAIKTTWVSGLNLCSSIMKPLSSYCPPFSNSEHSSLFLHFFFPFFKKIQFPFWDVLSLLICFSLSYGVRIFLYNCQISLKKISITYLCIFNSEISFLSLPSIFNFRIDGFPFFCLANNIILQL